MEPTSSNPILWKRMAPETRTPNDTHPSSRRSVPQRSGDKSPKQGWRDACQSPEVRQPKTFASTSHYETHDPTALKHHPRTRTKPLPQRGLLTAALHPKKIHVPAKRAKHVRPFDHTEVPHGRQVFHRDVRPMSPTQHMCLCVCLCVCVFVCLFVCFVCLFRLFVSFVCFVCLCRLFVSCVCVVSLCRFFVSFLCVVSLCRFFVSFLCVVSLCRFFVSFVCVVCLCRLFVSFVCVVCLCRLFVSFVCVVCLCRLFVSFVCVVCLCRLFVSFVCVVVCVCVVLCVCVFVCLCVCVFGCLVVWLFGWLVVCLCVCLFLCGERGRQRAGEERGSEGSKGSQRRGSAGEGRGKRGGRGVKRVKRRGVELVWASTTDIPCAGAAAIRSWELGSGPRSGRGAGQLLLVASVSLLVQALVLSVALLVLVLVLGLGQSAGPRLGEKRVQVW